MQRPTERQPSLDVALALPSQVKTRGGGHIDPRSDLWEWTEGPYRARTDFELLPVSHFNLALKHSLIPFLIGSGARHVENLFYSFHHFLHTLDGSDKQAVTVQHISNYAARLDKSEMWRVGTLNVLLQKWVELGQPGIEPDCGKYLRERRKPGNTKGNAVLTRDPIKGPLSEDEYTALYSNVNAAYGSGELPLWSIVFFRLLVASGGRVSQYASLKIRDFDFANHLLWLPQAKTGDAHQRFSFLDCPLSPQTAHLTQQYIDALKEAGYDLDAPLFPAEVLGLSSDADVLRSSKDSFRGHCHPPQLSSKFTAMFQPIAPFTSRLDFLPTPISCRRFRYTLGTRLAEEGASEAVIANRLGHTDLQNAWVYTATSKKLVEAVDAVMGPLLAPLAQAFRGRLVKDEDQTTQKGALGSRIIDFRTATKPVGSCGAACSGCSFDKPVACYTCIRFEPWLDAPHHLVLDRLEAERKALEHDERLAAINDEAIRAVKEVIALCAQILAAKAAKKGAAE